MRPNVKVQSLPSGFDGTSTNGIMPLRVSKPNERVLYQVHPGESIFIEAHTISLVPKENRVIPILTSVSECFEENASQSDSQPQSSARLLESPKHDRIRSILSSLSESDNVKRQLDASSAKGSDEWNSDHTRHNPVHVVRDGSRKRKVEISCGVSIVPNSTPLHSQPLTLLS